ncbi:hypothetical protein AQUCO_04400012v1 [Aquilegia coerulea]|uniref:Uncharacterized protein n=1 Tax=Aquilegia coerulea TaxID=218851 RepID=A0A2G5CMQ1_AQUCA|nr:hypothetical protein AQUCO_04400012v1 [Aquilegia coerulea]
MSSKSIVMNFSYCSSIFFVSICSMYSILLTIAYLYLFFRVFCQGGKTSYVVSLCFHASHFCSFCDIFTMCYLISKCIVIMNHISIITQQECSKL